MVDKNNIKTARVAVQDGIPFDLKNVLNNLAREMIGKEKAVFVMCPVCKQPASVPILPSRQLQTVRCRHCTSELKFRIMGSGAYKVKSDLGVEYVVDQERTWKSKTF